MAKRKKVIDDPVLGKLTFDWLWGGHVRVEPLGEVELLVDGGADGEPPTDAQRQAVVELQERLPKLVGAVHQAIYKYYCDNRDQYVELAIEPEEDTPELSSVKEVGRVLRSPPTLVVEAHDEGELPELKLCWNVTFDLEHSLYVALIGGEIQEVGIE